MGQRVREGWREEEGGPRMGVIDETIETPLHLCEGGAHVQRHMCAVTA